MLKGSFLNSLRLVLLEIKLIQAFIFVLATCKIEEAPIKTMKVLELSQHYPSILRCSRAAYSIISDGFGQNSNSSNRLRLSFYLKE